MGTQTQRDLKWSQGTRYNPSSPLSRPNSYINLGLLELQRFRYVFSHTQFPGCEFPKLVPWCLEYRKAYLPLSLECPLRKRHMWSISTLYTELRLFSSLAAHPHKKIQLNYGISAVNLTVLVKVEGLMKGGHTVYHTASVLSSFHLYYLYFCSGSSFLNQWRITFGSVNKNLTTALNQIG